MANHPTWPMHASRASRIRTAKLTAPRRSVCDRVKAASLPANGTPTDEWSPMKRLCGRAGTRRVTAWPAWDGTRGVEWTVRRGAALQAEHRPGRPARRVVEQIPKLREAELDKELQRRRRHGWGRCGR